ncbi:hypothetical protein R1flu_019542 [Riccia fluitans]|uniref:Uncharacterized protein n=1 Tax=Riccia fluitans TaxID=41844 RepID=A0ABD1ZMF3_9MARC
MTDVRDRRELERQQGQPRKDRRRQFCSSLTKFGLCGPRSSVSRRSLPRFSHGVEPLNNCKADPYGSVRGRVLGVPAQSRQAVIDNWRTMSGGHNQCPGLSD